MDIRNVLINSVFWGSILLISQGIVCNAAEVDTEGDKDRIEMFDFIEDPEPILSIKRGELEITYEYNDDNARKQKCFENYVTTYQYDKGKLCREDGFDYTLTYEYDFENERYESITYDSQTYYYDYADSPYITYLIDVNGNYIAKYNYDELIPIVYQYENGEWVEENSENFIGNINPLRANDFYLDKEINIYYVDGGIYYDPDSNLFIQNDFKFNEQLFEEKIDDFMEQQKREKRRAYEESLIDDAAAVYKLSTEQVKTINKENSFYLNNKRLIYPKEKSALQKLMQ